jgi:hypothetical protein
MKEMEQYTELRVRFGHRMLPHLTEFIFYLLLFQFVFITVPMIFLNIAYYLFSFSDINVDIGLVVLLLSPGLIGFLIVFILKKVLGGVISDDSNVTKDEHKFLTVMCYWNGVVQFILYMFWLGGFDGASIGSFILMIVTIYSGVPLAIVTYKKIKISNKKNLGILLACLTIGLFYAFTINKFNDIFLLNSVCYVILPWMLYLIQQNSYKFRYTSNDVQENQYLWIPRDTKYKCQPVTMNSLLSMFIVIAIGNVFSSVFYYTSENVLLSWILFVFFLIIGITHVLIRFLPRFETNIALLLVLVLIIVEMILTEYVPGLKYTIFSSVISGIMMGILINEKIKFKNFNHNPDNAFAGYILSGFFMMVLSILLTFVISNDGTDYPTIIILNAIILLFAFFTILFGFIRAKILFKS